ncbi:MAG: EscU/YscU/HrcU family type III secretion system export apparatus switch protein [Oscillospiraceae bacterium]|nr:EscU/YscU/HrcU family type III secretion system export apparatus switch protein [Oscillospiraceae bacterium]
MNPNVKPIKHKAKKNREAASLRYDPERDYAPQVTAAGRGYVAETIIKTAREAGVPVYRDEALAETLNRLSVGDMIPRELFEVVAEVLAFVIGVDQRGAPGGSIGRGGSDG